MENHVGGFIHREPGSLAARLPKSGEASARDILEALSPGERANYRYSRAIAAMAGERVDAGLEMEVSQEIGNRLKRMPGANGFFAPTTLRGALETKTASAGGYTVATELAQMIDLLRNRSMLVRLGARVLSGLQGDVSFPVKLSGATIYWVGENPGTDVTESEIIWGQRAMTPKICQATTAFSRKLLVQSSLDIESEVRRDLADGHAVAIDAAGIDGTGLQNQPQGLLRTTGIGSVADVGGNGSIPDWGDIVDLETKVATANGDINAMAYLSTPGIRGLLKQTQKAPAAPGSEMIWLGGDGVNVPGNLNGYPAYVSNQVPSTKTVGTANACCHSIIFGDWSQVYIGEWGVLELLVDPFAYKKQGLVEVCSYQMVDVIVKQPAALAAKQDAKLS